MGYTWTNLSTGDTVASGNVNEVKTNVDDLYTDKLELSAYQWVQLPVSNEGLITNLQFQEMRTAIDYASGQNYCRVENSVYQTSDRDSAYITNQDAYQISDRSAKYTTVQDSYNSLMYSSRMTGVQYSYYVAYFLSRKVLYESNNDE